MKTIKSERIRLGLTQHQLADLTGIPFRTIQNWETGQRKCPEYVEKLVLEKLQRMGEPDQKHGQWVYDGIGWACSECGEHDLSDTQTKFCPNCGVKMDKQKKG